MNWFGLNFSSLVIFPFFGLMTQQYFDNWWLLRPRLIESEKFLGCRDRDSSRRRNFVDVKTETHQDWKISWMSKLRLIETEKFLRYWDQDSSRLSLIGGNMTKEEKNPLRGKNLPSTFISLLCDKIVPFTKKNLVKLVWGTLGFQISQWRTTFD